MVKSIFLVFIILLSGCSMSNDEIIEESNKCYEAGMKVQVKINGISGEINGIICWPTEHKPIKENDSE